MRWWLSLVKTFIVSIRGGAYAAAPHWRGLGRAFRPRSADRSSPVLSGLPGGEASALSLGRNCDWGGRCGVSDRGRDLRSEVGGTARLDLARALRIAHNSAPFLNMNGIAKVSQLVNTLKL